MAQTLSDAFCLVLPCNRDAPSKVRAELDNLEEIDSVRSDAKLVATEIVSNAILHSGCTAEHVIEVCARVSGELFEISVQDPGLSDRAPHVRDNPEMGGLGLVIVEKLSHRWGMAQTTEGRLVWAQLLTDATRSPRHLRRVLN